MPEYQQMQQSKNPEPTFQKQATPASPSHESNPYSIIQRARINPKSLTSTDVLQLQRSIGNRAVGKLLSGLGNPSTTQQAPVQREESPEEDEEVQMKSVVQREESKEEEPLQGKFASGLTGTLQSKEEAPPNKTGMPDHLKSGIENISGMDLSGVRVHYNSSKPAKLNALAYAQGSDIHVAPGQERHLPHEAWHVVQQAQGRVNPTMQAKGLSMNDDKGLEHEADMMGMRAGELAVGAQSTQRQEEEELQTRPDPLGSFDAGSDIESRLGRPVVQRLISADNFEKSTRLWLWWVHKGKSAQKFASLVELLRKYESLPAYAPIEAKDAKYIPEDVEKRRVLNKLLAIANSWLASDASQTSSRRLMVTELKSELEDEATTTIAKEEAAVAQGGAVPWVEYGNIYLSVTETGEQSWMPIIYKRFTIHPETNFSIFSGTHGEANGYVINDQGLIDERHLDAKHTTEDSGIKDKIIKEYTESQPPKTPPKIDVIDISQNLRKPDDLKAQVKACSAGNNVAILAWCYSVTALTKAENAFVGLDNEVKTLYDNLYKGLNNVQKNTFSGLWGKDAFEVDKALQRNEMGVLRKHDEPYIDKLTKPPPKNLQRLKNRQLSEPEAKQLEELLDKLLRSRRLYIAQKAVPIPDIMTKWAD